MWNGVFFVFWQKVGMIFAIGNKQTNQIACRSEV